MLDLFPRPCAPEVHDPFQLAAPPPDGRRPRRGARGRRPGPDQHHPPPKGEGPRLTEAQKKLVFPETRSLAVQDHQARIAILQRGERCIAAALDGDGLRACMRQERDAIQAQRQRHREQLRQVFLRQGIAVPQDRKRPGEPLLLR